MEIVSATIEGIRLIPPNNEPYKSQQIELHKITHFYEDGLFESYFNSLFGSHADPEFFDTLPESCVVELIIKDVADTDKYYQGNDFKNACFNRGALNPYQLPKFTQIK